MLIPAFYSKKGRNTEGDIDWEIRCTFADFYSLSFQNELFRHFNINTFLRK